MPDHFWQAKKENPLQMHEYVDNFTIGLPVAICTDFNATLNSFNNF